MGFPVSSLPNIAKHSRRSLASQTPFNIPQEKTIPHHVINNNDANDRYDCIGPGVEEILPSPIPPAGANAL